MGNKKVSGSFNVTRTKAGTPYLKGTARVDGIRHRRGQTFDRASDAHRMKEALESAAQAGDYRWLTDPDAVWDPAPYLGGGFLRPTPQLVAAPVSVSTDAQTGEWTLEDWIDGGGARSRILHGYAGGTLANYTAQLDAITQALGEKPLDAISRMKPNDLVKRLRLVSLQEGKETVMPLTVKGRYQRLKDVMRDAWTERAIVDVPQLLVENFQIRVPKKNRNWFTLKQLKDLIRVLRAPRNDAESIAFILIEACLYSGLRYGEVAAWRWKQTLKGVHDFIPIEWAWNTRDRCLVPATKEGEEWQVPLTKPLSNVIERARSLTGEGKGLVFAVDDNYDQPILYTRWRRLLVTALDRASVEKPDGDAQKAFRNTFIVWGKICGVPVGLMQAQYGHTTTRMVQQTYDGKVSMRRIPGETQRREMRTILDFDQLEKKRSAI